MKKVTLLFVVVVLVAAFSAQIGWGKGHVPGGSIQLCVDGEVVTMSVPDALGECPDDDVCLLPACDFNNIFVDGEDCDDGTEGDDDDDDDDDGGDAIRLCELEKPRDSAEGMSPACPVGTF